MEVIDKTHDEISTGNVRHGLTAYISFNNQKQFISHPALVKDLK